MTSSGRVGGAGGHPTIAAGIIAAAGVQKTDVVAPAPDDHFGTGPYCGVTGSAVGRVSRTRGCPTVGNGIISLATGRWCWRRCWTCTCGCSPCACGTWRDKLCAACLAVTRNSSSYQQVHPRRSFRCRSTLPCERTGHGTPVVLVGVQLLVPGLYLPPVFKFTGPSAAPPQTIISLPVHTAV